MNLGAFIRFTLINTDHLVRHIVPIADLAESVCMCSFVQLCYTMQTLYGFPIWQEVAESILVGTAANIAPESAIRMLAEIANHHNILVNPQLEAYKQNY